jgi:hypothetical protein
MVWRSVQYPNVHNKEHGSSFSVPVIVFLTKFSRGCLLAGWAVLEKGSYLYNSHRSHITTCSELVLYQNSDTELGICLEPYYDVAKHV